MIEVDDGLNTGYVIRKINVFILFDRKLVSSKNFSRSQKALFITMDLNFFREFKLNF